MKKLFVFTLSLILFLFSNKPAFAVVDPLAVSNNKFGIHISNENDLTNASKLVNSTGGDWGYITIVITQGERDHDRWQQVFDQMRRLHLIPIIRIATKAQGDTWQKPDAAEINNWIAFLNSLNWVVQNRYIVIGNEPNLDNEWGGKSDATGYAQYLIDFSQKLKSASGDFFVLPAGLAPEPTEFRFLRAMLKAQPDVFDHIDGWTSHSYPTASIALYKDELKAINKDLPVFITETGWSNQKLSEDDIGNKLVSAYQNDWTDPKIVAVTPFILNYPQPPFGVFSWEKSDGTFYSFYTTVQNLNKIKGEPVQIVKGDILGALAQPIIPVGSDFLGAILAKNTGQSIWSSKDILIGSETGDVPVQSITFQDIEPNKLGLIIFKAASTPNTGIYSKSLFLTNERNNRITHSFPIDAYITKIDQQKIQDFFGGLLQHLNLSR